MNHASVTLWRPLQVHDVPWSTHYHGSRSPPDFVEPASGLGGVGSNPVRPCELCSCGARRRRNSQLKVGTIRHLHP
jgi:hypothetical protein